MRNKKGQMTALWILVSLVAVMVVGGGIFFFTQSATPENIQEQAQATKTGEIAVLKAIAHNKTNADNPKQVTTTTGYFWEKDDPTTLISGASVSLTTTATSVKPVNINDVIQGIAFDSAYYGDVVEKEILTEGEQMQLPVHMIAGSLTFRMYENDAEEGSPSIDITGGEKDTFNKFVIANENRGRQYRLKMLCSKSGSSADVSNITSIEITGMNNVGVPLGKKGQHFCAEYAEVIVLNEFDEHATGAYKITGDADGCAGNEETVTITAIDEAPFQKIDGSIGFAIEKDDSVGTDTGATDSSFTDTWTCS